MEALWQQFVEDIIGRIDGPMHFRIIMQPLMAVFFAIVDGVMDAKTGKPAYLWAMASDPSHRAELLKDGWKHFGKIFIIAIVLDFIYQLKVLGSVYPGQMLIVAFLLAVVPYALLRGPVNRIARLFRR